MISIQEIRTKLTQVLHLKESPHRTALAFAIGVFIAFSPTYGLHTLSVVFCAWAFRLNFLAVFLGAFINNPWTIAPILAFTMWTGFLLLGKPEMGSFSWENLSPETLYDVVTPYIIPFALGGLALSLLGALISYPIVLFSISRSRRKNLIVPDRMS